MIMNSLCALALGYVLDMAFGDPGGVIYPPTLVRRLVQRLDNTLRRAYADHAEARVMAGIMLLVLILALVLGLSAGLLFLAYRVWVVLGIILEGILCWYAISVRSLRTDLKGIFRSARNGNIVAERRYLKKLTIRDVEELDTEQAVRYAVEASAEEITERIISPIFWIMILGGVGGVFCRCVNIIAEEVGHPTENYRYFGQMPSRLCDIVNLVPSRIAAWLMRVNAAFLKLDGKRGWTFRAQQGGIKAPVEVQTKAMAAGILGVQLGGRERIRGEEVETPLIPEKAEGLHLPCADDAYWMVQLVTGVSAYGMLLAAVVRVAVKLMVG